MLWFWWKLCIVFICFMFSIYYMTKRPHVCIAWTSDVPLQCSWITPQSGHGACVKIMTVTWHGCIVDLEFISSSNCTYTFTYKTSLYGCTRSVMQACSVQWYRWFCKANTCSSGDQSIGSISSFVPKTVHIRKCCENSLNQWKLVRLMLSFYELRREVSVVCGGVCACVCSWSGLQVCFCRLANTYNYIFPAADVKP